MSLPPQFRCSCSRTDVFDEAQYSIVFLACYRVNQTPCPEIFRAEMARARRLIAGEGLQEADEDDFCQVYAINLIRIFRRRLLGDNGEKVQNLAAFLSTCVRNRSTSWNERRVMLNERFVSESQLPPSANGQPPRLPVKDSREPDPSDGSTNQEAVAKLVENLSETDQAVWTGFANGKTSAEVGAELGMKPNTVDKRRERTREAIRNDVTRRFPEIAEREAEKAKIASDGQVKKDVERGGGQSHENDPQSGRS